MRKVVVLLAATLFLCGCGSEQGKGISDAADKAATQAPAGPVGRIRGVVRFQGDAPPATFEPVTENQSTCGDRVALSRLALGKDKGVQRAFVYLDGVKSDEKFRSRESLLVDQKNCQYAPHSLIVPVGGKIDITNSDPILHNVHGQQITGEGSKTLFNIAQPVRGQRTTVESPLTTPGIVFLTCEAGHPWMNGYVFVADHPFVSVTGDDGQFVIEGVPAGTYKIKMWHEGVRMTRNIKALQRYEYEEPYEITQDVTVTANGETVVNFDMALRPTKEPEKQ
ncbi:MAG TPA: carboxypeptidase regulatory-like domain-containing protein [Terriglobia bacterium]|jgi:plastocyanin